MNGHSNGNGHSHHFSRDVTKEDPYADVREKLERLAAEDKKLHCGMTATATNKSISENMPLFIALTSYIGYAVLISVGHCRDLIAKFFKHGRYVKWLYLYVESCNALAFL